jgi:hypothetical protein
LTFSIIRGYIQKNNQDIQKTGFISPIINILQDFKIEKNITISHIESKNITNDNIDEITSKIQFPNYVLEEIDEKFAYNFSKLINTPFIIISPYSHNSNIKTAWPHWHALIKFIIKKYPNITFVLVGFWNAKIFSKYNNIIDLTYKTPHFMQILALLKYAKYTISTTNSLPIWNNIHYRKSLVFDNCNPNKIWFHWITNGNGTVRIVPHFTSLGDGKNIAIKEISEALL